MSLTGNSRSRLLNYLDLKIQLILICNFIPTTGLVKLHSRLTGDDLYRGKGLTAQLMAEYPNMYEQFISEALNSALKELNNLLMLLVRNAQQLSTKMDLCYLPVSQDIYDTVQEFLKTHWFNQKQIDYQIHELTAMRMMIRSFLEQYTRCDNYIHVPDFLSSVENLIGTNLRSLTTADKLEIKTILYMYQIIVWLLHTEATVSMKNRYRYSQEFDALKGANLTSETVALCPSSMLPYARAFQEDYTITPSTELTQYLSAAYEVIQPTRIKEGNRDEIRYIGPYRYFYGGHPRYRGYNVAYNRDIRRDDIDKEAGIRIY